jgi:hypothetical protein
MTLIDTFMTLIEGKKNGNWQVVTFSPEERLSFKTCLHDDRVFTTIYSNNEWYISFMMTSYNCNYRIKARKNMEISGFNLAQSSNFQVNRKYVTGHVTRGNFYLCSKFILKIFARK